MYGLAVVASKLVERTKLKYYSISTRAGNNYFYVNTNPNLNCCRIKSKSDPCGIKFQPDSCDTRTSPSKKCFLSSH